jgi:pimeloyl-ACP methyl ester carboxylesterase
MLPRTRSSFRVRPLLLVALGCSIALARTHVLTTQAEAQFPPEGRFVEVDGTRVHYVDHGRGRPIVLVHGAYGGLQDWTATIYDELASDARVIALDRPGHGWSERPRDFTGTPLEQARFLHAFLHTLGVERPVLAGFSWGGALVAAYALEYPDELAGAVMVNACLYPWKNDVRWADWTLGLPLAGPLLAHTLATSAGTAVKDTSIANAFDPSAIAPLFTRSPVPLALRPSNLLANAEDMRVLNASVAIQSTRYAELHLPLTLVCGLGDRVTGARFHSYRMHAEVEGAVLVSVERAGHQILYSHPRAVIDAIRALVERVR